MDITDCLEVCSSFAVFSSSAYDRNEALRWRISYFQSSGHIHDFLELWSTLLNDKHSTIKFNLLEWSTVVIPQNIFIINIEFYQMYAECFYCIWWLQTLIRTWMNFVGFSIQSWFFSHFFQSWYPLYFENLQREAMKTSKTSSRTKLISIC